jgi:preprotein translocase subunit SecB
MSDEQPVFSIEKIYVKDLSIEVPNAPQIFLERETPSIEVQIQSAATRGSARACSKSR